MSRDSLFLVLTVLVLPALAVEPARPPHEAGIILVGDESLLGPVAFGDTARFWETHALVFGTVERARLEYDQAKMIVREHLRIRVNESIPHRHKRRVTSIVEHPVVAYDRPAVPPSARYHAGDELMLIAPSAEQEFNSYAMMPGGQEVCTIKELKPAVIEDTKRLCKALATTDLSKRLERIDSLLQASPNQRTQIVLQRRLESSTEELQAGLQESRRLLELVKGMEPRQIPDVAPALREESMSGIVTARSGRVVVLQNDEFFSVNKDTRYFRETGLDPAETTAEILTQGTALMAVGSKDIDGEFVARRVYALGSLPRER